MKKVILYPGSFSPLHIGHLCLANYIVETVETDELWFLLTPSNPFKDPKDLLPESFRAEWIAEVLKLHPKLKLSTDEFGLPEPNYTYNTLRFLSAKYPDHRFTLLAGMDSLIDLPTWYRGKELMAHQEFLIYPRPGYDIPENFRQRANIQILDDVPTFEISSTEIREMIARGCNLPYFLTLPASHPLYRKLRDLLSEGISGIKTE